jgi:myo-inositol catabolism protein IolC
LLYADGLTIRGVQKVLKDRGLRHVAMIGRGDASGAYAAPKVIEKVVFVEKPAALPKKRPTHLRAVPDPISLPFFDAPMEDAGAREERVRLKSLLGELLDMKAKLRTVRR